MEAIVAQAWIDELGHQVGRDDNFFEIGGNSLLAVSVYKRLCDRIAVLGNKKVLVEGSIDEMLKSDEPWVESYFRGKRARQLDLAARK